MARKAISPLIATLILIAITITGGVVVYRLFYSTSSSISTNVHATITEAYASQAAGLSVTVKNDGSSALNSLSLAAASSPSGATFAYTAWSGSLAPGASAVLVGTVTGGVVGSTQVVFTVSYGSTSAGSGSATMTVVLST